MSDIATLSEKFQISIPKAVRAAQGYKPGQKFAFIPAAEGMMLVPIPTLGTLMGSMSGADPSNYRDRDDRF
jgi:AbrB family looped-hinge helix DNA binding protein